MEKKNKLYYLSIIKFQKSKIKIIQKDDAIYLGKKQKDAQPQ